MSLTALAVVSLIATAVAGVVIVSLLIQRSRREIIAARNAAMLRAVPDLMFVQTRDGVYLDVHAADTRELLLAPEMFLGRNMRDVLPRDVLDVVEPLFTRLWTSDGPVIGEYTMELGGETRYYEVRLFKYRDDKVLSLIRDVTDRTRIAAALRASEERYALATKAGSSGVWDWDLEKGSFYVDPRFKAMLGFADHEIADTIEDWGRHVNPDDLQMAFREVRAHIDAQTPSFAYEYRMIHRDGSVRWFSARGSVVRHPDGTPARVLGTTTDITEQKQTEEALHRLQMDLERTSRLATLGEFGSAIAHEVRQPLAAIVINAGTCLRLLSQQSVDLEQIRATLSDMADAGKRADALLRRARELFGTHTLERRPVEVNNVIREVVTLTDTRLRNARVRIEMRLARDLPQVQGDRIALSQVVLNLVSNSIDAMATTDPSRRVLTITSETNGNGTVQVSVRDQGVGLDEVDTARMFMPAYTTKPSGAGVGLSVSRTIIEAHGGALRGAANDGPGSTFTFSLPVTVADAVPV